MYQFKNGKKFYLQCQVGEVLQADTHSRTEVHQTLAYGMSSNGVATVTPGSVLTSSYDITKIWIRRSDGSEEEHNISNFHVPVRAGHKLAVMYGGPEGETKVEGFAAYNITTGQIAFTGWQFFNDHARRKRWGLGPRRWFRRKAFLVLTGIGLSVVSLSATLDNTHSQDAWIVGALAGISTWCVTMLMYYLLFGYRWAQDGFNALEAAARKEFAKL